MQLLTLGGLRLDATDFTRPKPLLLLCYLAIEGSQSRRVLADLFFADTKDPRDSLSTAYRQLRSIGEDVVVADGDRLGVSLDSDANKLIEALDAGLLEPAIELYDGAFLDGLDLELGEELEEWVFATREYLAGRVREANLRVGESLVATGDPLGAARHAESALDLPGAVALQPHDVPRVLRLLEHGHSPRVTELRSLANEFAIDVESLDADSLAGDATDARRGIPSNLPPPTTSFVGRDTERLEIAELLSSGHGRIVTIHGPGGIGKSRLAQRAARDQIQEGGFPDGVYHADLEPLSDAAQITEALAGLLGDSVASSIDELTEAIGNKRILFVLDGFEHLLDAADILSDLVVECPNVRFVVASRERLRLTEEHVLSLKGLSLPPAGADRDGAVYADALQLVLQRAKKTRADFELQGDDLRHAIEICRRLDGSPLGIELAMSWIRVMPLEAIRHELERDLTFLESSDRNARGAHENLRAVFNRSWEVLEDRERNVLPKLALFRGGFRREAAAEVAGATLPVLVRLVDASLISVSADGRYHVHALVQQFCEERLDEDREQRLATAERYRSYYRAFTRSQLESMYTSDEPKGLASLSQELPNILSAWEQIFNVQDDPERLFPVQMVVFFDRVGLIQEGVRFFETARSALTSLDHAVAVLLREVDASLAWLYYRHGRHQSAEAAALRAMEDPHAVDTAAMVASNTLAVVRMDTSRTEASIAPLERAVAIANQLGDRNRSAMYLINLGRASSLLGEFVHAIGYNERAIEIAKAHGYPYAQALALNNLAATHESMGNFHRAAATYRQSLDVSREHGYRRMVPRALINLAECFWRLGDVQQTTRYLDEALASADDQTDRLLEATCLHARGRIELHQGDLVAAEQTLLKALEIARSHQHDRRDIKILPDLAAVWISQQRWREAEKILKEALAESPPGTQSYLHAEMLMKIALAKEEGGHLTGAFQALPLEGLAAS